MSDNMMETQGQKRGANPQAPRTPRGPAEPSMLRTMDNPFLVEEEFVLPFIPDTEEWHFCWIRYRMGNEDDMKNMNRFLTGKLPYEIVTADKLPDTIKQTFAHLRLSEGTHAGRIGIGDVLLGRCSMPLYKKYIEATQIRADNLTKGLTETVNGMNGDRRTRFFVEEDSEREGIIPGRAMPV